MRASGKILLCILVILIVVVPLWPAFESVAAPMDEGSLLVYPELISKGQVPYRDFETFYGPANLWVLSGVYALFSTNIFVERAVGLAYRILLLAAIFAIVQRWSKIVAIGCTLLAGIALLPILLPAYAWIGGVTCALWSIWIMATLESRWRGFLAGTLAGLALLFRPDLGLAVIASAVPFLFLIRMPRRLSYLAGMFAGLLPLVWLSFQAGPREILNNLLLFPVLYCNSGRRLPIFSAEDYLILLFIVHLAAAVFNVLTGAVALYIKRNDVNSRLLLGLGLFGLGLTHQAAQRIDLLHVVFAAFISISILPLSIFVLLQLAPREALLPRRNALLASMLVFAFLGKLFPEFTSHTQYELISAFSDESPAIDFVKVHDRSFPMTPHYVAVELSRMLRELDSVASTGERLFVGPADLRRTNYNDTFIYHLTPKLRPASYFLEMNPLSANRPNSRLANDVGTADWLILDRSWDVSPEPNESAKFGSDLPMRVISQQFELCGEYGPWDVYRRKRLAEL